MIPPIAPGVKPLGVVARLLWVHLPWGDASDDGWYCPYLSPSVLS
jgi:hypothetical protein